MIKNCSKNMYIFCTFIIKYDDIQVMRDLKKIGKRIQQFMEKYNIGVNELGKITNTSGAQISNILKGKKYGIDKFLSILDAFPRLNAYWVISGQGDMELPAEPKKGAFNLAAVLKELEEQKNVNEKLKKDLKNLKLTNEKISNAIEYQDLTIEAYKKTVEVQTASIQDLKEMLVLTKTNSDQKNKRIA
jgi:hypothetical protein